MENARVMGEYTMNALKELQKKHKSMGDVRGLGLLLAVEFVLDRKTKAPAKAMANEIMQRCFELGLMTLTCGQSGIRLCPPLIVDRATIDQAMAIFDRVITEMEQKYLK